MQLLERKKSLSIVEISEELKLSHPAIVQFTNQLLQKGLIKVSSDKSDRRKRIVSLSLKGKERLLALEPFLKVIRQENAEWLKQADSNLLTLLDQLEEALDKKSMYERIQKGLD